MSKTLVIIVTYNAHNWIYQCLNSINITKYDVIVIDNKSTDNTVDIIKTEYPNIELVCSKENLGFGKANNIGLQIVLDEGYDYAFLLNQDAWLERDTIDRLIDLSKKHQDYGIFSPLQKNSLENKLERGFEKYLLKSKIDLNQKGIQELDFANAALWLIPRNTIEIVGGFNPIFPHYGEDNDYVNRVHYWDMKVGVDCEIVGYHDRVIKNSVERKYDKNRLKISFLVILCDINKRLIRKIIVLLFVVVKKSLKMCFTLEFINMIVYFKICCEALNLHKEIKKMRRISREKKAYLK